MPAVERRQRQQVEQRQEDVDQQEVDEVGDDERATAAWLRARRSRAEQRRCATAATWPAAGSSPARRARPATIRSRVAQPVGDRPAPAWPSRTPARCAIARTSGRTMVPIGSTWRIGLKLSRPSSRRGRVAERTGGPAMRDLVKHDRDDQRDQPDGDAIDECRVMARC